MDQGSMDPLSWTGFVNSFVLIMRNEQKQKKCQNKGAFIIYLDGGL